MRRGQGPAPQSNKTTARTGKIEARFINSLKLGAELDRAEAVSYLRRVCYGDVLCGFSIQFYTADFPPWLLLMPRPTQAPHPTDPPPGPQQRFQISKISSVTRG